MVDGSNSSRSDDRRRPRREVLLQRLAQMLEEMRASGIRPPAALVALVERGSARLPPRP